MAEKIKTCWSKQLFEALCDFLWNPQMLTSDFTTWTFPCRSNGRLFTSHSLTTRWVHVGDPASAMVPPITKRALYKYTIQQTTISKVINLKV